MLTLVSPRLVFTRDGRVLVTLDDDAATFVDTRSGVTRRVSAEQALATVAFGDQVWIAHGRTPVLARYTLDGQIVGQPIALEPSIDARLIAAPVGAPAAVWTSMPASLILDDGGVVTANGDLALPFCGRRVVTAAGNRVRTPSGLVCELSPGARVVGGAVVLDGTAALVVSEHNSRREIALVGLANARVLMRQPVGGRGLRVAARRGVLAVRVASDRIAVIDLRSGRLHIEIACRPEVSDFCLDDDGQRFAFKAGNEVELATLASLPRPASSVADEDAGHMHAKSFEARIGAAQATFARDSGTDMPPTSANALRASKPSGRAEDDDAENSSWGASALGTSADKRADAVGATVGMLANSTGSSSIVARVTSGDRGSSPRTGAALASTSDDDSTLVGSDEQVDATGSSSPAAPVGMFADEQVDAIPSSVAALVGTFADEQVDASSSSIAAIGTSVDEQGDATGNTQIDATALAMPGATDGAHTVVAAPGTTTGRQRDTAGADRSPARCACMAECACTSPIQLGAPLVALAPRRAASSATRELAIARLGCERDVVLARALAGIAAGWDTRRLAFANEGSHPFEHEVVALLGTSRGHAEDHVTHARRRRLAALVARQADRAEHFAASPLGELAHELGLSPLELDILMSIAAPTLWGETARLYAVLANDAGRGVVDEMLVVQLLDDGAKRYDIAAALAPDATLRRYGLVRTIGDRARPFTQLAIDPVVAARLCGEPMPVPDAIRVRAADVELADLVVPVDGVRRILEELARAPARSQCAPRLVIRGRRGSGRRSLLAAIAARAHRALGVIDVARLGDDGARLRDLLRAASLCGLVPCLVGSLPEQQARVLVDAIALHPGPVVAALGIDEPALFPPGHLELVLPNLSAGERLVHWRGVMARHGLRIADVEAVSSRYRLTPGMLERAAAHVGRTCLDDTDHTRALEGAIRQGRDERLTRLATRVTRLPTWADVVLPPDVLDSLRELIGRVRHGRRVFEEWGFDAVMTTGRGLTALFDGRPGTGKTMVAGIVARELGLDLYRVDVSRLVSKWIGETEKNLSEIFDAVDDGQAIILFDEADSLFGKRTEVKSSNDRYANLEVNYLLQRIDTFDGIAILTTNFGSAIDPAFRRRVSFRLSFPFPDEEAREQLWRVHLPARLPIEEPLDLGMLARKFQLAGGYIRNACLRAAFLAAQEETMLAQRHLERAVQLEYQQVGKISTSGPVE